MAFVHHVEMRAHRFVVADALRVVAMHEIDEFIGQRHRVFFHHFIVADDVDDGIRRNHGDAVERFFGQFDVGDFDDAFSGHTAAVEVVSDGDATFHFVESQQVHHFESDAQGIWSMTMPFFNAATAISFLLLFIFFFFFKFEVKGN